MIEIMNGTQGLTNLRGQILGNLILKPEIHENLCPKKKSSCHLCNVRNSHHPDYLNVVNKTQGEDGILEDDLLSSGEDLETCQIPLVDDIPNFLFEISSRLGRIIGFNNRIGFV